jgi:signal transduction histidine kinase
MVGRTLEPVEAIRAEVADIGSEDLHRRVPLPNTRDEIDDLAKTMNQMLERLEISSDRQRRFVSDASHELRTPLTRIRSELELTLASAPDAATSAALGSMLIEVVEMQAIVEDLLYLARSDAGPTEAQTREVDLDDILLRESEQVVAGSALRVDVSGVSAASVMGDIGGLSRAVRNLADNAVRHATSTIRFTLRERDGWAELTVGDDGPGIPEEDAELVFERFGRLDMARSADDGGSGLGLAIAREIVTAHGGDLRLVNPGEPGAVFEMRLPLSVPD